MDGEIVRELWSEVVTDRIAGWRVTLILWSGHPNNDLDGPGRDVQVGRQSPYPEEFRKDAVALYRASGGKHTYAAVASELGSTGETLRTWVRKDSVRSAPEPSDCSAQSQAEELTRLRADTSGGVRDHGRPNDRGTGWEAGRPGAPHEPRRIARQVTSVSDEQPAARSSKARGLCRRDGPSGGGSA
jgi:transposase